VHQSGDVYFIDSETERIRRIRNGVIEAVAGNGRQGGMEGNALSVRLGASTGMALHPAGTSLYFTEETFDTLRKLDLETLRVTIVAGNGTQGFSGDGGAARAAMLANPTGVAVDAAGNVYVAEAMSNRIRKVSANGTISTFAGGKVPYAMRWGGAGSAWWMPMR
jgi:DNA-binding beta-propeller fold protein YncE